MADVRALLKDHLHGMAAPFLFVGAGLSRRYVAADDWEGLLRHFAGFTDKPYEYYKTTAGADLPTVASKLAPAFHEAWWVDPQFKQSRDDWATKIKNQDSALKVEVALRLKDAPTTLPTTGKLGNELTLLRNAVIDGIITTNFDPILEHLFPDFRTFVGQDGLLFSNPQGVGELYKIHGSHTDPDSLVLTAEDYERFEERNAYLAAKLMTIFVEHPVIFLGYRLSDRNVLSILKSIASCLTQNNIDELRDRLIFVQWDDKTTPAVTLHTIVVDDFMLNVVKVDVPDFEDVFGALASLTRVFPAKLLRRLKEQVYDLVLTDDPHSRLVVSDIEDATKDKDIDVVFGVGMQKRLGLHGYVGLDRWDLIDDVISGGSQYDPELIVGDTLPKLLKGPGNVPVFKYLRESGMLDQKGNIKKAATVPAKVVAMADKIRAGLQASDWHCNKAPGVLVGVKTLADLEKKEKLVGVLNFAMHMAPSTVDLDELRTFLDGHRELRAGSWNGTQYVKLACFYDWLAYGRKAP